MSERPPPPPGYKYDWLGRLQEDVINYTPPPGYRLTINFFTHRLELAALFGPGLDFGLGDNARPKPATQHNTSYVVPAPIPESKIGKSVRTVEGLQETSSRPVPGSDKYDVRKRDQAIFG